MTVKRCFSKICLIFVILSMIWCGTLPYCVAEAVDNNSEFSTIVTNDGFVTDLQSRIGTTFDNDYLSMPETYDPRQQDILTDIRDQGDTNLCWMYSAAGAVEQFASKKYGSKFNISAAHGGVALSNSMGNGDIGYYNNISDFGGNTSKALQYFTNWNTPILNSSVYQWCSAVSEDEYSLSKIVRKNNTIVDDDFENANSLLNVTSAHYINLADQFSIKQSVKEYGAVMTAIIGGNFFGVDSNGEKIIFLAHSLYL